MYDDKPLLTQIHCIDDVKKFCPGELSRLADEIRETIISTVSKNGGHLASNLGVVELTIALHRVFNSPQDKIIWDVGHQCYTHKLLTGRVESFAGIRKQRGIAGFPKLSESPHDAFNTGHASTSISAALGMLAASRIQGERNRVVAVIGDGALTGGLAYEALSHTGQLGLPLVVILNDNKMSISPNVGGLSKYLSRLSMKSRYQSFRRKFDAMAQKLPFIGPVFFDMVVRLKRAVKAVFYTDNFFVDLGFEYVGPIDGHQIPVMEQVFRDVRKLERPVVIHVITRKGKGYAFAEDDPGAYHGVGSFSVAGGLKDGALNSTFTQVFGSALLDAARRDGRVTAVTAAMEKGTGLSPFKAEFPHRFFDTGIAEGHAVTFAAGLAAKGLRPVAAIYSTFMQRAVDQVIHDVSLQHHPVVFALDRCGLVGEDGETHQGIYDISLFRPLPDIRILTPAAGSELSLMLDWTLACPGPSIIRYPKGPCPCLSQEEEAAFFQGLTEGRGVFIRQRPASSLCIAFTGSLYPQVRKAADILESYELSADLYHLRFLKPLDEDYFAYMLAPYRLAVIVEEGVVQGGFGGYAAEIAQRQCRQTRVLCLGVESAGWSGPAGKVPGSFELADCLGTRQELLHSFGLDEQGIAAAVLDFCAGKAGGKKVESEKRAVTG
ncbi:MAG: 1-deoxy-D-xylulose-5-phosphate synthase [Treponema sp.]|jgi:1-deoxy-D-xylulose-5-phosphate synthase|nr:1-deoxy-D-xylulose-5-phosphate synthase [Treponema sp.]